MQGMEVWPNAWAAGSYDTEVQYLINWLNLRIAYLDSIFNNKSQTTTTIGSVIGSINGGSPTTLTAQVSGGTNPTGTVSFFSASVLVGAVTLDSTGTAKLIINNLPAGENSLQAVYNGDTTNALSVSDSEPVTVTAVGGGERASRPGGGKRNHPFSGSGAN